MIGPWSRSAVTKWTLAPGHLAAGVDGALVGVQPGKHRQQRRMDVDQPAVVALHEARREDAHEAGQGDDVGPEGVDRFGQLRIEGLARREAGVVDHRGGDAVRLREAEAGGVGAVADHRRDPRRPRLGGAGPHDRLHVRAPPEIRMTMFFMRGRSVSARCGRKSTIAPFRRRAAHR
jgi:hypothetical protein